MARAIEWFKTFAKLLVNPIYHSDGSVILFGIKVLTVTTSREYNVAGLSSAVTLANSLKATINAHYADAGSGSEEHTAADTAIASDDAVDIDSLVVLVSEMQDSYVAHNADSILADAWAYHQAQGTTHAVASATNPTNLQTCITVLNDLKAKLNLHMADDTSHTAGDSTSESEDNAAYGVAIAVPDADVKAGDLVHWGILNDGSGNVTGVSAVAGAGQITFTFSADPQNDAIVNYLVLRQ